MAQGGRQREADGASAEGAPLRSAETVTEEPEVLMTGCRRGRRGARYWAGQCPGLFIPHCIESYQLVARVGDKHYYRLPTDSMLLGILSGAVWAESLHLSSHTWLMQVLPGQQIP